MLVTVSYFEFGWQFHIWRETSERVRLVCLTSSTYSCIYPQSCPVKAKLAFPSLCSLMGFRYGWELLRSHCCSRKPLQGSLCTTRLSLWGIAVLQRAGEGKGCVSSELADLSSGYWATEDWLWQPHIRLRSGWIHSCIHIESSYSWACRRIFLLSF